MQCSLFNRRGIAIDGCEKVSGGVPCYIYATQNRVLWQGEVTVSGDPSGLQSSLISGRTNKTICIQALSPGEGLPRWEGRSAYREYIEEAKRRGLNPLKCADLLGRNTVQSGTKDLSLTAPPIPPEGPSQPVKLIKCRLPDGFVISMIPKRCRSVGGEESIM